MRLFYVNPLTVNDTGLNGGISSASVIPDSSTNNLLPVVTFSEVKDGLVRWRKLFIIPEIIHSLMRLFIKSQAEVQYALLLHAGTETDTQEEAEHYTKWKGSGTLNQGLTAGVITQISVESDFAGEGFNPLDIVRISDGVKEDYVRISDVAWSGVTATLTCIENSVILNSYSVSASVSACIEKGRDGLFSIWVREEVPKDTAFAINITDKIGARI